MAPRAIQIAHARCRCTQQLIVHIFTMDIASWCGNIYLSHPQVLVRHNRNMGLSSLYICITNCWSAVPNGWLDDVCGWVVRMLVEHPYLREPRSPATSVTTSDQYSGVCL